jgi:LysM repeat protein
MIREMQTRVDDLRHAFNCSQTELQILEGRIKAYEHALASFKQQDWEKWQEKLEQLHMQQHALEKKVTQFSRVYEQAEEERQKLMFHANETSCALTQFKNRIVELEKELQMRGRTNADEKVHKVRPGDTLEKIARLHKTTVEHLKKLNRLDQDLIVVGQELIIP